MKKVKIVFWVVLLAVLAVFGYQNWQALRAPMTFEVKIWMTDIVYKTPEAPLVAIFAGLFLLGLLIAYFYSLYGYFRQNKTIKHLNATVKAQTEEIESLKRKARDLEHPVEVTPAVAPETPPATADA